MSEANCSSRFGQLNSQQVHRSASASALGTLKKMDIYANITTWSSANCGSNPFCVPDSERHDALYAAISYSC